MAVLTHKALHGGAPRYLTSLVHITDVPGRRALRSAGSNRLQIPPFKLPSQPSAVERFRSQQHSFGTDCLTMSRRPILCLFFAASNWNIPCSSSHYYTLLCDICLIVTPIVVLAVASLRRPLYTDWLIDWFISRQPYSWFTNPQQIKTWSLSLNDNVTKILRYRSISSNGTVLDSAPHSVRTQLLQAAVMLQRNGRCRFQLNVTTCVDDWSCFHVMHLRPAHYFHCPLYLHK